MAGEQRGINDHCVCVWVLCCLHGRGPTTRAKALCIKESITFHPCYGLQQMSALQNCGIPFSLSLHLSLSLAQSHTHRYTPSLLEVLSVKAGYFVLFTFDCCFHGGLVKSANFATRNYNKQRKLETRQTFWGTADVHRHPSQTVLCPQCSRETYTNDNSLLATAS